MEVEKQKDDGQSGGSSNRPQSSDVEIKWDFGSFIPLGLRTATPMSEGGGEAFKWTVGPYGDRLIGGGTRVRLLAYRPQFVDLLTREFDRARSMVTCVMALAIPVAWKFLSAARRFRSASTPSTCRVRT